MSIRVNNRVLLILLILCRAGAEQWSRGNTVITTRKSLQVFYSPRQPPTSIPSFILVLHSPLVSVPLYGADHVSLRSKSFIP